MSTLVILVSSFWAGWFCLFSPSCFFGRDAGFLLDWPSYPHPHPRCHGTPSLALGHWDCPLGGVLWLSTPTRCSLGLLFEPGRVVLRCVPLPRS